MRMGMRFDEGEGEFIFDEEQLARDKEENEDEKVRIKKRCLPAMNYVNKDLNFTTEAPEDFKDKRLPILDFVIWMVAGIILHSYYEKLKKSQYTVLQRSAMGEHQRMTILSNELVSRLSTIHRDVLEKELEGVIEKVCVPTEDIRIWAQAGKRSSYLWGAGMEKEA